LAISEFCMRCLAKDPADRFASPTELRTAAIRLRRPFWRNLDLSLYLGRWQFRLTLAASCTVLLFAAIGLWSMIHSQPMRRVVALPVSPQQHDAETPLEPPAQQHVETIQAPAPRFALSEPELK